MIIEDYWLREVNLQIEVTDSNPWCYETVGGMSRIFESTTFCPVLWWFPLSVLNMWCSGDFWQWSKLWNSLWHAHFYHWITRSHHHSFEMVLKLSTDTFQIQKTFYDFWHFLLLYLKANIGFNKPIPHLDSMDLIHQEAFSCFVWNLIEIFFSLEFLSSISLLS